MEQSTEERIGRKSEWNAGIGIRLAEWLDHKGEIIKYKCKINFWSTHHIEQLYIGLEISCKIQKCSRPLLMNSSASCIPIFPRNFGRFDGILKCILTPYTSPTCFLCFQNFNSALVKLEQELWVVVLTLVQWYIIWQSIKKVTKRGQIQLGKE